MFDRIRLQHFKAWRDTGEQRLAPLTVFFGTNSAGKSSLSQFLLTLKQTIDSPDRHRALHLGDRNSVVDLGTFHDVLFNHDLKHPLSFTLGWQPVPLFEARDPLSKKTYKSRQIELSASIVGATAQAPHIEQLTYTLSGGDDYAVILKKTADNKKGYALESEGYKLVRTHGRVWPIPAPVRFYGFPDEAIAYYQNADFISDLALAMEQAFSRLYYLGPLRGYPERSYIWSGEKPEHVGWRGERAVEAILAAKERIISRGTKKRAEPFAAIVARWLKAMGLITEFNVKPIAKNRKDYEVLVKTSKNHSQVNLTDVGFGLSQVLPVIVQCFYAPPNATIIFEQPEIHLHPQVQASLADLFIEAIKARENGKDRNIQLIVESHSEHFLRRLQRRIAEEQVTPAEVAIFFCQPSASGSIMAPLKLDAGGHITNWPDNFFGDEMGDLVAMTEAAIKRQQGL